MLRLTLLLLATFLLPWVTSCSGGSRRSTGSAKPALSWTLRSDRLDGQPGTTFQLQALVAQPSSGVAVRWELGDGRQASGETVAVSYPSPGAYTVVATASAASGDLGSATLTLLVFDPSPTTIAGTDIPLEQRPGDVDADTALTTADVALIQGELAGVAITTAAARRAADFDFDGDIDAADASLLAETVQQGGVLPTRIEPTSGPRTSMVRVVSEHLTNLGALVEVQVGQSVRLPLRRIHPGYGLFAVPMDALGPPTLEPIVEGPVAVQLFVDGVAMASVEFQLVNAPPIQGDEPAVLDAVVTQLAAAAAAFESSMTERLQLMGADQDDAQVLSAVFTFARTRLEQASQEIGQLLAQMTPDQLEAFSFLCSANGLRTAEAAMASVQAATLAVGYNGTGSDAINFLFGLNSFLEVVDQLDQIVQVACSAAFGAAALSSIVTGPLGLVVAAEIFSICESISLSSDVLSFVKEMFPKLTESIELDVQFVPEETPRTWHILPFAKIENLFACSAVTGWVAGKLQERLMKKLTSRFTVLLSYKWLEKFPFEVRSASLRQYIVDFVRMVLESLGTVLGAFTPEVVSQALGDLQTKVCTAVFGEGRLPLRCSELSSLTFSPQSDGWLLTPPPVGSIGFEPAVFSCDGAVSGTVSLQAVLPVSDAFATAEFFGFQTFVCDKLPVPITVPIAAGTFQMGSTTVGGTAVPVHEVEITQPFWMGKFEVSQAEYQAMQLTNPSHFQGLEDSANRPVEQVSFADAEAYCTALNDQESAAGRLPAGYLYRLPTEAEWEYCCRAGTTSEWHTGGSLGCDQANISSCVGQTRTVGAYNANGWGLHDMHGNVDEWCLDSWDGSASYPARAVTDPFGRDGSFRVVRGGYFNQSPENCRSAVRSPIEPGMTSRTIGFRVVLGKEVASLFPGMVPIAAGTFNMGSPEVPFQWPHYNYPNCQPVHPVTITRPFWIGKYEVTQAEYQSLMGVNPSFFQGVGYPKSASMPVEQVSWLEAVAYCDALTVQEDAAGRLPAGYVYRLPTEAEWEYCCRAGTTTEFHCGEELFCDRGNAGEGSCIRLGIPYGTTVVGSYAPNAWGLHDMHGNVLEWCMDSWDVSDNYSATAVTDPFVTKGSYSVARGGSFDHLDPYCGSADRFGFPPGPGYFDNGFRVVCAPPLP